MLLKFIGLYCSQVLIHVKFIHFFFTMVCSVFQTFIFLVSFGFVAFVAPFFPSWKLQDILGVPPTAMSLNTETSQQLTVIVDKLARIQEAVKYLSVQVTLLQLSTK